MCLSYLPTCVFAREVVTGLLLARPSLAHPDVLFCTLLHSTALPGPVPSSFPCHRRASFRTFPVPALPVQLASLSAGGDRRTSFGGSSTPSRWREKGCGNPAGRDTAVLGCHGARPGSRGADPSHGSPGVPAAPLCRDVPEPRGRAQRQQAARSQGRAGGGEGMAGRGWPSGPEPLWDPPSPPWSRRANGRRGGPERRSCSRCRCRCRCRTSAAAPAPRGSARSDRNQHRDPVLHPPEPAVKTASLEGMTERKKSERRRCSAWSSDGATENSVL